MSTVKAPTVDYEHETWFSKLPDDKFSLTVPERERTFNFRPIQPVASHIGPTSAIFRPMFNFAPQTCTVNIVTCQGS